MIWQHVRWHIGQRERNRRASGRRGFIPMSATREHRNAARIEEAGERIGIEIEATARLANDLASVLPDDFPYIEPAIGELRRAHENLMEKLA